MRKDNKTPITFNKLLKTAVQKATGENIEGATPVRRRHPGVMSVNMSNMMPDTVRSIRTAQMAGNTNITAPNFYNPFTTPSAFQIPNNRKEVYLWAQWWFDNEPKVAAAIEFYSDFPVSGFKLECANGYVKDYFEELVKKLNFRKWLPLISQEYHLRGDSFILASIDCEHCKGLNVDDKGNECTHDGATWGSITVLNPDTVESTGYFLDKEPRYYIQPDDAMVKVVSERKPKEIFDDIPEFIRKQIMSKQPIWLESFAIHHLKRGSSPWQPYGTSMVRRLFPTLAYKDKLRQAQWLVAERHIIPIKIVKIGSDERPASDEDIAAVQEELTAVANDPLLTLVTHHNFNFEYYGAAGKVLQLTNEYDIINQEIIDGFMLNKAILNGEGPSYSNAQVGLLVMAQKLEKFRGELSHWIEEKIFKPVAEWNGFTVEGKRGQEEVIYPTIKWDDLKLRDNTSKLQTMQAINQAGSLSTQTLLEELDVDYDQEVERLRFEQSANMISTPDANITGGGMGGGYGGGGAGGGGGMPDLGGMGGDAAGGATPEMGGEAGMGGDMGGMAPPAGPAPMASTQGSEKLYKFAVNIMNELYDSKYNPRKEALNQRTASKLIKSAAHQNFLESLALVSGRGAFGKLPEEPPMFSETIMDYPSDGGLLCLPMNNYARSEWKAMRIAAKKQEERIPKMLFSTLEQKLYNTINLANIPYAFYAQYQAGPSQQYQLDAAFPALKLGIEADSKTFHSSPEKIAQDRQRDVNLATQGWTILRFTEEEIEEQQQEILNVIYSVIRKLVPAGGASSTI